MPQATARPPQFDLASVREDLADADAERVVRWAADTFAHGLVLTSSFGAQAAVMLHLVTRVVPDIPVVFIDTGYLFPETYAFAQSLTKRLGLNVKVYQPVLSPARHEALHGKQWEQGDEGLTQYNQVRKVEPMQRALRELSATAWLAGLRSEQSDHRASLGRVEIQDGVYKVHPILKWAAKDVHDYLTRHGLPYHPLYEKGYRSIGDTHSTEAIGDDAHERSGRFHGLKQECGLHLPATAEEDLSRGSSGL